MSTEWKEIAAWKDVTFTSLKPLEAETLHFLCKTYIAALQEYDGNDSPRPYYDKEKPRDQSSIKRALRGNK